MDLIKGCSRTYYLPFSTISSVSTPKSLHLTVSLNQTSIQQVFLSVFFLCGNSLLLAKHQYQSSWGVGSCTKVLVHYFCAAQTLGTFLPRLSLKLWNSATSRGKSFWSDYIPCNSESKGAYRAVGSVKWGYSIGRVSVQWKQSGLGCENTSTCRGRRPRFDIILRQLPFCCHAP